MSFGRADHKVHGGRGLAIAGATGRNVATRYLGGAIALAMLLVACDREPYARPERMLVGFATVKPLAKEDLEEVHALDATISDAAVLVPLAAVVGRRGGAANDQRSMAVFRIDANGRAVEVAIEGHVLRHNDVVVTRGLDAGAKIVVEGAGSLYDNAPVSARPAWTLRGSATD